MGFGLSTCCKWLVAICSVFPLSVLWIALGYTHDRRWILWNWKEKWEECQFFHSAVHEFPMFQYQVHNKYFETGKLMSFIQHFNIWTAFRLEIEWNCDLDETKTNGLFRNDERLEMFHESIKLQISSQIHGLGIKLTCKYL